MAADNVCDESDTIAQCKGQLPRRKQAEGMHFEECFGEEISDHLPQVFRVVAGDEVVEVLSWNIMMRGASRASASHHVKSHCSIPTGQDNTVG